MAVILIPLKDIIVDPGNPVDLSTLPEAEAIRAIKACYGFLSKSIEVSLEDGIAVITTVDRLVGKTQKAKKIFQRGVGEARQGNYRKAVSSFTKVLELLPEDLEARRNLAMAYLEMGDGDMAKRHLEQCQKLDPADAWTYVLLGNIYAKKEQNPAVAEFYFQAGLAVAPDDYLLMNNYAALLADNGNHAKARELFEKTIAISPAFPNSYIGLAGLYRDADQLEEAIALLGRLFEQPVSTDIRLRKIYQGARTLYLELTENLAERESPRLIELIKAKKSELEQACGYRISIEEDNSLEQISAVAQMAWKHARHEHRIRYRMKSAAVTPHLIAHELEHVVLEHLAREKHRNLFFTTTNATKEKALSSAADHMLKLRRQGYEEDGVLTLTRSLISGLCGQLFNCPIDMVIEKRLQAKYPELQRSQFVSLHQMYQEGVRPFTSADVKKVAPPQIFRASTTLNIAYALFIDHLYGGRTGYASAYRGAEVFSTGEKLFDLWLARVDSLQPGDEYRLVDEFAEELKIRPWYEWQPDPMRAAPTPTEKLKVDSPEARDYCLDALRRFAGKSREEIFTIASEIALAGMKGIDHNVPEKTHSLNAYPGEIFSGLHLLCLMYVGFQLYDSGIDSGLDFSEAYGMALEMLNKPLH